MSKTKLALFGGKKTINYVLEKYNSIGKEEVEAAKEVLETGVLSKYLGVDGDFFLGGPKVREFEKDLEKFFNVKNAITVNSWTSGLIAAVGALDVEPGDEIIVTPWTMSASATAILHWNAIPVFADIDGKTFNLDPTKIEAQITNKTKAIMVADIFGQSSDIDTIMDIAKKHGVKVISDTAQAPGAMFLDKYAGTLADIGGFSLNYHKHIHTGEGGIVVTNNDRLAEKIRLIRNHAEAVLDKRNNPDLINMLGHNFRLGEIECAIGIEQLKKLPHLIMSRQKIAEKLNEGLANLRGLITPYTGKNRTHVYYMYALKIEPEVLNLNRSLIYKALIAEGVPLSDRYQNIHLLPLYQKKIAYGNKGFPWNSEFCTRKIDYAKGICPIAERLNDECYLGFSICEYQLNGSDIQNIISAFQKVWANLEELQKHL